MSKGPRRARAHWLEGAPEYVIDCMYSEEYGEWTILLGGSLAEPEHYQQTGQITYLGVNQCPTSPNMGISMFGEVDKKWRRTTKERVSWLSIPEDLRNHIIRRCK